MEGRLISGVRSDWESAVFICRKCSKRQKGGFGGKGKTRLAKALRRYLGARKGRKAKLGIVEVKCLSACPKKAVTAVRSDDLLNWKLIEPGTPIEDVAEALGVAPAQE
jgi:predicted metal-binding protein